MLRDVLGYSQCLYKDGKLDYRGYCECMFCNSCNKKFTIDMWLDLKERQGIRI
jgi:hypothetical protein